MSAGRKQPPKGIDEGVDIQPRKGRLARVIKIVISNAKLYDENIRATRRMKSSMIPAKRLVTSNKPGIPVKNLGQPPVPIYAPQEDIPVVSKYSTKSRKPPPQKPGKRSNFPTPQKPGQKPSTPAVAPKKPPTPPTKKPPPPSAPAARPATPTKAPLKRPSTPAARPQKPATPAAKPNPAPSVRTPGTVLPSPLASPGSYINRQPKNPKVDRPWTPPKRPGRPFKTPNLPPMKPWTPPVKAGRYPKYADPYNNPPKRSATPPRKPTPPAKPANAPPLRKPSLPKQPPAQKNKPSAKPAKMPTITIPDIKKREPPYPGGADNKRGGGRKLFGFDIPALISRVMPDTTPVETSVGKVAKTLPPPFRVNPLIKLSRWSLLLAGVWYGAQRNRYLKNREVGIRAEEQRKKAIRDAQIAEERRRQSDADIEMLSKMLQ